MNFFSRRRFQEGLWILLVLLLPFTSLPLMARLTGMSMVAPPSILPLLILIGFWWLPTVVRGGRLPAAAAPIAVFALFAIISAAAANFIFIPTFRNAFFLTNSIEALITLGIGIAFFLLSATWVQKSNDLRFIFRWINIAGCGVILWSLVQAFIWYDLYYYPDWAVSLQSLFSSSGNLYQQRATGFAYEPSWLAHQLNMLFLPYWLAATLQKTSAHAFRVRGVSLENILLVGGGAVLFLSLSRIGWLSFIAVIGFLLIVFNVRFVKNLRKKALDQLSESPTKRWVSWALPVALVVLLLVVYIGLIICAGFVLSKIDYRMAELFSPELLEQGGFREIANRLVFAERVVYWETGFEIFTDYPILGVGPGNSGYFFPQKMVAFGWGLDEISTILYQMDSIPNTKSLWARILAENGVIGFSIFIGWLYVLWLNGIALTKNREPILKTAGWMGIFVLVAILVEGFSVDTYALPYYWFSLGLLAASHRIPTKPDDNQSHDCPQRDELALVETP